MLGWCQDTEHYCTQCNRKVTHKPHDGQVQVQTAQPPNRTEPSRYATAAQLEAGLEKPLPAAPAAGRTEYQRKVEAYRRTFDGAAQSPTDLPGGSETKGQL